MLPRTSARGLRVSTFATCGVCRCRSDGTNTRTNRRFYARYHSVGGSNGHFDFQPTREHGWSSWRLQLAVMAGDLVAVSGSNNLTIQAVY